MHKWPAHTGLMRARPRACDLSALAARQFHSTPQFAEGEDRPGMQTSINQGQLMCQATDKDQSPGVHPSAHEAQLTQPTSGVKCETSLPNPQMLPEVKSALTTP